MLKPYFILLLLPLPILLAACAPRVGNDLENYRMPTDVPGAPSLTETAQAEATASTPPESCPVTVPQDPLFVPPPPYSEMEFEGYFWYGSNFLWAALPENGVWSELPQDSHGYTQKIPWWREGYVWNEEPEPPLQVTGERLDAKAPPMESSSANGAYAAEFGSAMMMGANFPTPGCWKITGNYEGTELSFVVWIAP